MSNNNKSGDTAFERRLNLYKKYGLKPTLVHKTGAMVAIQGKHIIKGGRQ